MRTKDERKRLRDVGRDAPIMRLRPQSPSREAGKLPATEMYSTGVPSSLGRELIAYARRED